MDTGREGCVLAIPLVSRAAAIIIMSRTSPHAHHMHLDL